MKRRRSAQKSRPRPLPIPEDSQLLLFEDDVPAASEFAFPETEGAVPAANVYSVLRHIALNQGINSPELARFFQKTMKTVSRFTTELRYRDFIEFRGSLNKGGYFLKPAALDFLKNPESDPNFAPRRMTSDLVFEFIREHPGANHYAIAAHFQRTIKSATRHTQCLRRKGKIVFRGTPRDGGFHAKKQSEKTQPAD